jgi:hypothetical protein
MKFAIAKGQITFLLKKKLGKPADAVVRPFKAVTDFIFRSVN